MNAHEHGLFFQNMEGGSTVSEMIAGLACMVSRRAPEMMRQGGGGLTGDNPLCSRRTSPEDRARIMELHCEGKTLHQIKQITGWSRDTVKNCIENRNRNK